MGYYDGLLSTSFHKAENGRTIFSPHGNFGKTYYVDDESEKAIKKYLKRYYMFSIGTSVVGSVFLGFKVLFLLFILIPYYYITIRKYLANCEVTETPQKTKWIDRVRGMALKMGLINSILLLCASILFGIAGVFMFTDADSIDVLIAGIIGIIFFLIGIVQFPYMIFVCLKNKKE